MRSLKWPPMTIPARALSLASALILAAAAPAAAKVSFQRIAGFKSPGTPAKYDKVGILKIGSPKRAQRARAQPGHVGERRVLRAARQEHRRQGAAAGRCGRSSGARTCSRTSRCSTRPRRATATAQQVFDYYLGWIKDQLDHHPLPADPGQRGRLRAAVGHEHRDPGPAPRRAARRRRSAARSSSAATRSAARSPPPTRPGTSPASRARAGLVRARVHRRRQQPDADHRGRRAAAPRPTSATARRGSPSAASRRRSRACSTRAGRWASLIDPNAPSLGQASRPAAGEHRAAGPGHERRPVRLRARHRDLAAGARRRAGAPRSPRGLAATRAAGTTPAS